MCLCKMSQVSSAFSFDGDGDDQDLDLEPPSEDEDEEDEEEGPSDLDWSTDPTVRTPGEVPWTPSRNPGPVGILGSEDELSIFNKLTGESLHFALMQTNQRGHATILQWKPLDYSEFCNWLAILFGMSLIVKADLK